MNSDNDENSQTSQIQEDSSIEETQNDQNQQNKSIYRKKKLQNVQQVCETYSAFLRILLGQEPTKQDLEILNIKLGTFSFETQETQLPDAILKFPNPDHKSQSSQTIQSLEAYNLIQQLIKSQFEGLTKKIFLKACEGAIQLLEDKKQNSQSRQKFYRQKVRRENQFVEFINTEESRRMETTTEAYEESQNQQKKDKLILKLSNKLTGYNSQFNSDTNVINEALEIDQKLLKFLPNKKMFKGGYLVNNGSWIRSKKDVKDFSSLVRNIIILILNSQGYHTNQFISQNGKYIFCSLYATEVSLKLQAESMGLQKILNLQFIDLFSFEPLDKSYRPLRLNNRLWKPQNYKTISPMLQYLRKPITDLIKEINFKKIAREVNQSGINQKLFNYEVDLYDDLDQITDLEWQAFFTYLVHLEKRIYDARKTFVIKSDIAALINQQITPQQLYQRRKQEQNSQPNFSQTMIAYQTLERIQNNKIDLLKLEMLNTIDEYKNIFHINQVPYTKLIKVLKKEQLANQYLQIFRESLKVANAEQKHLHTLWDRLHLKEPVNIKLKYSNPSDEKSLHQQHCSYMCWKKYQLNQGEKVTIFQSSERLRMAQMKIYQTFNVQLLKDQNLLKDLFCLHDNFELYGLYYANYDNLEKNREQFYQEKLFDVSSQLRYDFLKPMEMKFGLLCQYFGEQVASYFYFLCNFSQMFFHQILLGLLYYGISFLLNGNHQLEILKIIYQLLQLQLTSITAAQWEQQIKIFQEIHSINNQEDIDFTPNLLIGEPKRSLINDQMNVPSINELEQIKRGTFSVLLFLCIQIFCSSIFIALYFLCEQAKLYLFTSSSIQNVEIILIAILHLSINKFYSYQIQKVIQKLVDFEQLRSVTDVKQSYNLKVYSFLIIQQIGPLLILRFFNYSFKLVCEKDSCENYIGYYFLTYVVIKSFEKLIIFLFNFYSLRKQSVFIYKFEQNDINYYIENQSKKASNIKNEFINTIEENLQSNMVEITILTYFAYIYPITYLMYWILLIVQIYADKAQYLYYYQRPWPQGHCFSKVWNNILKYIIISSIIIASFGISDSAIFSKNQQIFTFVSFMLLSFTLNFLCQIWYSATPSFLVKLNQRQKYLIKSTIEKFKKKAKNTIQFEFINNKKLPLYKIFGSKLEMEQKEFETLSSDSDLEKYFINTPQSFEEPILHDGNFNKTNSITIGEGHHKNSKKKPTFVRFSSFYEKFIVQKQFEMDMNVEQKNLFRIVDQLVTYQKTWNNLRLFQRNYYFPRKNLLVNNLDHKRFKVILSSLKRQKQIGKQLMDKQYRRKINRLKDSKEEHDRKELLIIEEKIQKYCHKYKWLNAQKFIFIKIKKAIWFNGFRKIFLKLNSKLLIQMFLKQEGKKKQQTYESEFQNENFGKNLQNLDLKNQNIIGILENIQIYYSNTIKYIPLANGIFNIQAYCCAHKKSQKFIEIVEKLRETYLFDIQKKQLQSIMMEYFEEENFPIPDINLIKQLNETSWLAKINENKQPQLLQFIQVKHGENLRILPALNSDRGINYITGEVHIRLSNYVDKIDDFYVKGYCLIIYDICPIATLESVIKQRKKYRLYYSNDEIYSFFYDTLLLLLRQNHGDLQSKNYLLSCNSYILVNTNKQNTQNDLQQLAKILIQMITLTPQQNAFEALEKIEKHELYEIIISMLDGKLSIEELLSKIKYQEKFQESFIIINQEINENQQQDFQEYLQMTLHKANFLLRIKHFEKGLLLIQQFENILHKQVYKAGNNSLEAFQQHIITNFIKFILNSNQMQEITFILMVFFIKFQIMIQNKRYQISKSQLYLKKQSIFQQQLELISFCLDDLIQNLDLILIQLQLNINLEQISKQEAEAIFGLTKNKQGNIIKLKHFERIRIINTFRQNRKIIENLFQFRKTIRRFQNQFNMVYCISQYFQMNLLVAQKLIDDCIEIQMELVRCKNKLELTKEMKDLSPDLYNYNQMSPKENKMDAFTFQINQSMTELCEQDPTYFHQLLYYYYLQIIIWHDINEKDMFERKAKSFFNMQIHNSPTYYYFSSILKGLIKDQIPTEYLQSEFQCEIGKFEVIKQQKWLEETYKIQSEYFISSNYRLMWKQIMSLSNIKQTLKNRQILQEQLNHDAIDLRTQLCSIRIIHQILHLDCYFPLNQKNPLFNFQQDILDSQLFSNTFISTLQKLHHLVSITSNSWFHSLGMFEFRLYHIQSIIFTFSQKHLENKEQENSMKDLAKNAIGLLHLQKENRDVLMKISSTLLEDYMGLIDKNQQQNQLPQIIYSTIQLNLSQNQKIHQIMIELKEYTSGIQNSILFLMILQILYQTQQIKQMSFLTICAQKSILQKSSIFNQMHENFENDLNIFQLMISNRQAKLDFIKPYDSLFKRQREFQFFKDQQIYSRYLIYHCLLLQNFNTLIEYIEDNLNLIQDIKELETLKIIFENFLIYLKISLGIFRQDKAQKILLTIHQLIQFENFTLFQAINKHILVRIYIVQKDYHVAQKFSEELIQFIYVYETSKQISVEIDSISKQKKKVLTLSEFLKSQFLGKSTIIQKIKQEPNDIYYCHLIDDDFICQIILDHLEILSNINRVENNIFQLLNFSDFIQNQYQDAYFYKIISLIIITDQYQNGIPLNDHELLAQVKKLIQEKKNLQIQSQSLLQAHQYDEHKKISNKLTKLNLKQIILQKILKKPSQEDLIFLANLAAKKSFEDFSEICKKEKIANHPFFISLYLILAETNLLQYNFQEAIDYSDYAEEQSSEIYGKNLHPQVGFYLLSRYKLKQKMKQMQFKFLNELKSLNVYDIYSLSTITLLLLQENKLINQQICFYYKTFNIESFKKNIMDLIKINFNFCQNFVTKGEDSSIENIFIEIIKSYPSLNQISAHDLLSATHHFVYLDEENQYRKKITQLINQGNILFQQT